MEGLALPHNLSTLDFGRSRRAHRTFGLLAVTRAAAPVMRRHRSGRIVTMSSIAACTPGGSRETMTAWWFLRKHPCWRVRFHNADTATVNGVLTELTATGVIDRWWPTIHEPESAAFGGHDGMSIAHTLFCQDTRGVLDYARQHSPGLGRRELSLLLLNELLRSAGLDTFERGDVFAQVAALRPTPAPGDQNKIEDLAAKVTIPLSIPRVADSSLFAANGPIAHAAPWLEAFRTAGHCLGEAAAQGLLDRGIRAILTHVLIFHWNRLGLTAASQGILAHAARSALLPHG